MSPKKIEEATKIKENQNVMFEQGKWHTLEIAARGSAITVFVDGRKALEMDNDTFPQGNFGFCSWGADLAVDDIRIVTYEDGKGPQPVSSLTTTAAPRTTTKAEAATTTQPATSTQAPSSGTAPGTAETTRGEETSPADGNSLPDDPSAARPAPNPQKAAVPGGSS